MKTIALRFPPGLLAVLLLVPPPVYSQVFEVQELSDRVCIVSNPDLGDQVVVQTSKGLLVFDSFWSEKTALLFKEGISEALHRDDFSYVINMVDRLDQFGGNAAYKEALIVGQENLVAKFRDETRVEKDITELIDMWRFKEEASRNRLKNIEEGSEEAQTEEAWMNTCKSRADELEHGFSLVLPEAEYNDRMSLSLGDITLKLFWLGEAGNYSGLSMALIPEEDLAILSKAIIYPMYHLAPYVHPDYGDLDVTRWIMLLEQILEGESAVSRIILCDDNRVYSRDLWLGHLNYIRTLWERVRALNAEGRSLREIQEQLSLDNEFAFVKEMPVYKNNSDAWIRPQHELHVKHFYLQGKVLASEILRNGGPESLQASLDRIEKNREHIYFDEVFLNRLGYIWMQMDHGSEAIEVFRLNAEAFPGSSEAYASLGEAYMKTGDTENAITSYKKSLELNPDNAKVADILRSNGEIRFP